MHDRPFIDGDFPEPATEDVIDNITPVNGTIVNRLAACGPIDVDRAVRAARGAFEDGRWSAMAPAARKRILLDFADQIEDHSEELAALEAIDIGKPYETALLVDVASALRTFRWYAEAVDKVYGEVAPTAGLDLILREPLGVVAAVVPWNYPLLLAAWKMAPALAAGNSVVLKPDEHSSLSVLRVAELASEAGVPPGVLDVVPGLGSVAGQALGRHPGVDAVTFTGSTKVAKRFHAYVAESTLKAISLECGGKSPSIIARDADVGDAVAKTAAGVFYNAGQTCNAPARLLCDRAVADEVLDAVLQEAGRYSPDNPLRRGTGVGAVVSGRQIDRILSLVTSGVKEGARVVTGGSPCWSDSGGFYFEPTVVVDTRADMRIIQEEVFGPVLTIEVFDSIDEALALANGTRFGLSANVFTHDLRVARRLAAGLRVGSVTFNATFGGDVTTPFGGAKESGTGRDRSLHALDTYTHLKHVSLG